jgi:hypothetical protein
VIYALHSFFCQLDANDISLLIEDRNSMRNLLSVIFWLIKCRSDTENKGDDPVFRLVEATDSLDWIEVVFDLAALFQLSLFLSLFSAIH